MEDWVWESYKPLFAFAGCFVGVFAAAAIYVAATSLSNSEDQPGSGANTASNRVITGTEQPSAPSHLPTPKTPAL